MTFDAQASRDLFLHCVIRKRGYLQKRSHFPLEICPKLLTLIHDASIVASVVNAVQPTTVSRVSHRASTFVYNTVGVSQSAARIVSDSRVLSSLICLPVIVQCVVSQGQQFGTAPLPLALVCKLAFTIE